MVSRLSNEKNGAEALALLKKWADEGKKPTDEILLMFTDAEMPEMDGYRLTSEVRSDPRMSNLFIALNTSLSGSFNDAMVEKVGCNRFISKFQPDMLVDVAQQRMREYLAAQKQIDFPLFKIVHSDEVTTRSSHHKLILSKSFEHLACLIYTIISYRFTNTNELFAIIFDFCQ